jgi:hypothetical protein
VKVIRLTRSNEQTFASSLEPEMVASLWRDPLLRFSRAFDALFHEAVVTCEGDSDTQFYSTVAAARDLDGARTKAVDDEVRAEVPSNDVMFTYAGSKNRLALVAKSLTAIGVPARVIADFDVLNSRDILRGIVEALGGDYTEELERLRAQIDAGLRGNAAPLRVGLVRAAVDAALGDEDEAEVDRSTVQAIRDALEPSGGWAAAKKSGTAAVPPGQATQAVNDLLGDLRKIGLFVVESGAVESFVKVVPNKGSRWVVEVIEGDHIKDAHEAVDFIGGVLKSLEQ